MFMFFTLTMFCFIFYYLLWLELIGNNGLTQKMKSRLQKHNNSGKVALFYNEVSLCLLRLKLYYIRILGLDIVHALKE